VAMIERHYGMLLDGAHAGIAGRLATLEADLDAEAEGGEMSARETFLLRVVAADGACAPTPTLLPRAAWACTA
jgi:hypothetical protein